MTFRTPPVVEIVLCFEKGDNWTLTRRWRTIRISESQILEEETTTEPLHFSDKDV